MPTNKDSFLLERILLHADGKVQFCLQMGASLSSQKKAIFSSYTLNLIFDPIKLIGFTFKDAITE